MPSLSASFKIGNATPSSLVKSAASLQTQIADIQDKQWAQDFASNPTTDNLNAYTAYLQNRVDSLNSSGNLANISKGITLSNTIKSATVTSTTFNIDVITGQMMGSGATDQAKLDYLTNNVLTNDLIQQNPNLYVKYQNQAYGLQQSIQQQNEITAIAAQTQAASDLVAQERGFTNGEAALTAQWTQIQDAYKNGNNAALQSAFKDSMAILAPIYKASGITIPKGFTGDMQTAKVGHLLGMASYYEHAAQAAGPDNPNYQSYIDKANGVIQGSDLRQSLTEAMAPSNLYSPSVSKSGQVNQVENAISGYNRVQVTVPGLDPVTLNIPTTTGNSQTPVQTLGKGKVSALDDNLKKLGFNIEGNSNTTGKEIIVSISDKAMKWLGGQAGLQSGERLTVIPTARGLQFQDMNNNLWGVSFDNKGLAGLYQAGASGQWQLKGGQYGFNPKAPSSLANATSGISNSSVVNTFKNIIGVGAPALTGQPRGPQMSQRGGGGYNFTNASGAPISAAMYSQLTGTPFRTLLQTMSSSGDTGAKTALSFVGNDYGYNPGAIGSNSNLYNSLTWGTGHSFTGASAPNISGGQLTLPSGVKL